MGKDERILNALSPSSTDGKAKAVLQGVAMKAAARRSRRCAEKEENNPDC